MTVFGLDREIGLEVGFGLLGDAVEQPVALSGFVAAFGDGERRLAVGRGIGLAAERDRLHLRIDLQLVLPLALVDVRGRGADAPEGLQAQLAVDDLVVLVLGLVEEAAELGEGAEGVGAL